MIVTCNRCHTHFLIFYFSIFLFNKTHLKPEEVGIQWAERHLQLLRFIPRLLKIPPLIAYFFIGHASLVQDAPISDDLSDTVKAMTILGKIQDVKGF